MNFRSISKATKLTNLSLVFIFSVFCYGVSIGQQYKEMMENPNVNFYDVINEAEQYFESRDKGKGSGWKQFERWVAESEHKYYPSGDRTTEDPFFAALLQTASI